MKKHVIPCKIGIILVTLLLICICILPATAGSDNIKVYVDGKKIIFEDPPVIEDGRTLVPMRAIFEAMGAPVYWDESSSTVIVIKDDVEVRITIGSNSPTINGEVFTIDVPAKIINDRTFVPLRFVSDAFGSDIDWFSESRTILVDSHREINIENVNNISIEVHIFNGCEDLAMLIRASYDDEEEVTTLIMAGNCSDAEEIIEKLEDNRVRTIDQLIVTTPFKKHCDGIEEIYDIFRVKGTIVSDKINTSDAYEEFMQENYPEFPLEPYIPDVSELIPDMSELVPDISDLIPDLSDLF